MLNQSIKPEVTDLVMAWSPNGKRHGCVCVLCKCSLAVTFRQN